MTELETLIQKHLSEGRPDLVVSLCEGLKSQRDRAERTVEAYLHEIKLLNQRFASMTKPIERVNTPVPDPSGARSAERKGKAPGANPRVTNAIEIDL